MKKTLYWASTLICTVAMTMLICNNKHVGYYESAAVIRPIMEVQENDTNACYWAKTLLATGEFDGLHFHETHDKQICLQLYMHDSVAALDKMVQTVDRAIERYSTKGIQSLVIEKPHIVQTPSYQHYILYAVLSFIFSFLSIGAIAIILNICKRSTP